MALSRRFSLDRLRKEQGGCSFGAEEHESLASAPQSDHVTYTPEELKSIQVKVGPKPGDRQVTTSLVLASGSSNHRPAVPMAGGDGKTEHCGPPSADCKCTLCGACADKQFDLCSRAYCSEVCQAKDRHVHGQLCDQSTSAPAQGTPVEAKDSPGPSLPLRRVKPRAGPTVTYVPERTLPGPDWPMVPVSATPDVLYLHQESLIPELQRLEETLNRWVTNDCEVTYFSYTKGDYVSAMYSQDLTWYRGQVVKECSNGKRVVFFLDHGNSEEIDEEFLRPLPTIVGGIPRFAFGVIPEGGVTAHLVSVLKKELFVRVVQLEAGAAQSRPVVRLERLDGTSLTGPLQENWKEQSVPRSPKADSDLAYSLQAAKTLQRIKEELMQVQVIERSEEIQVQEQEIMRREKQLEATVRRPAEAEKYRLEKMAEAVRDPVRIREGHLPDGAFKATLVGREGNHVYLCTIHDIDKLVSLKLKVAASSATSSAPKEVSVGDAVCTQREDQEWYRATVTAVTGDLCKLLLVDCGTTEVVQKDALRLLPQDLASCLPALAVKAQLDGVGGRLTDSLLRPFMGQEVKANVTNKSRSGPPSVVAFDSSGACLNSILSPLATKRAAQGAAFDDRPLPSGRTRVRVSHVTDLGQLFYLQQHRLLPALEMLMEELNAKEPSALQQSRLGLGTGVCARYPSDGRWHRAIVVATPQAEEDDKYHLRFVDYGYTEAVPINDIRALPEGMKDTPSFVDCVGLKGVRSVSNDCKLDLQNFEYDAEVVDRDRLPHQVKLYARGKCVNRFVH